MPLRLKRALPHVARSTLLVMAATLASTILGFGREIVNARYFGTHWELDTFLAAATIPTIVFGVFNGALVSALVPVFSSYIARGEEEAAWALGNTVFHILAIVLTFCAVLGWVFAPWYVPYIAHGFPGPQLQVAIRMTRWLMPSIIATSLAGILNAMLNAYHRFTAASFQGVAINVVTLTITIALFDRLGIYALVLGYRLRINCSIAGAIAVISFTGSLSLYDRSSASRSSCDLADAWPDRHRFCGRAISTILRPVFCVESQTRAISPA